MANGKAKGSGFEREIAKKLSLWWSGGADDNLFWRTQNSGGRFTSRKKVGLETEGQAGDISSTSPETKCFVDTFVVELKSYKNINLWSIITGSKGTIVDWWNKLFSEAFHENKLPLLIVKENFKPILVFTSPAFQLPIYDDTGKTFCMYLRTKHLHNVVNVYLFEELLECDPKKMKELCKEHSKHREQAAKCSSCSTISDDSKCSECRRIYDGED